MWKILIWNALFLAAPCVLAAAEGAEPARKIFFFSLYIPQILAVLAALTLAGWLAERSGSVSPPAVRTGWNWLLLVTFAACLALGLVLLFPVEKPLKFLLLKVHIWTGVICGWAGLYHACRRLGCMLPRRAGCEKDQG